MNTATKARIAVWDNARFVLIVFVVMAHAISTIRVDTAFGFGTYTFIYLFHMPAMIALSGLFAKTDTSPKAVRSTVQLLVTWVIWEVLWALIHFFVNDRGLPDNWLVTPAWTMWFLVTLATMRIVLPYVMRLRFPLLFSIVIALLAGLTPAVGTEFSASRTLCFLPFFVAGHIAMQRGWFAGEWFTAPQKKMRVLAAGLLALIAVGVALLAQTPGAWRLDKWLTWRDDYVWLFNHAPVLNWQPEGWLLTNLSGVGIRFGLLVVAFVMMLAFVLLVPRKHSIITVWGTRTLYVYLLHGPIVFWLRQSGVVDQLGELGNGGVLITMAIGLAVTLILSMTWVTRIFRPVIEPRCNWLYGRDENAVRSTSQV